MAQYLISVLHDSTGTATPEEMAAIDVFNDQLLADGHWVFAGGLASPRTATVIDGRDEEAVLTDVLLRGDEGVRRGLLDHRGPPPRRHAPARHPGVEALQPEGRAPAVAGLMTDVDNVIAPAH